jgi:RNA polymerase sigma-70 factor (ECF subfamily)
MSVSDSGQEASRAGQERFCTTRWSVVLLAGQGGSPQAAEALETLCRTCWYPLYAFVRRKGHDAQEAQDLTQAFFARLLEKNYLSRAHPGRGRFRSFLISGLSHFLINEWDRARAEKRGGGQAPIFLGADTAETWYGLEPATDASPEKICEKRWALALLEQAVARLGEEQMAEGKARQFEQLKPFLSAEARAGDYDRAARELGTSRDAVAMAVSRLRKRYRDLVREEVAHTVASPNEEKGLRRG